MLPSFSQFSTHMGYEGKVIHRAYVKVPHLDHVCVYMDTDGKAQEITIYVPELDMFFETKVRDRYNG